MEKLDIHKEIYNKLNGFIEIQKIPNILFHGKYGCGKKTIVDNFINKIYNNNYTKDLVLYVNCSHGKGIKFIREELKFFAKTNVQTNENKVNFKIIVLSNADKLTMDAQSALRRCIELSSYNTRFFVIAEDKYKLMKPILSRFCEIYIPEPMYKGEPINLYKYILDNTFKIPGLKTKKDAWLNTHLQGLWKKTINLKILSEKSVLFYDKGYSSIDIMELWKKTDTPKNLVEIYLCHNKMRQEIRNEKVLILMLLNFIYLNNNLDLKIQKLSFI
jgi:hypothetical protein